MTKQHTIDIETASIYELYKILDSQVRIMEAIELYAEMVLSPYVQKLLKQELKKEVDKYFYLSEQVQKRSWAIFSIFVRTTSMAKNEDPYKEFAWVKNPELKKRYIKACNVYHAKFDQIPF